MFTECGGCQISQKPQKHSGRSQKLSQSLDNKTPDELYFGNLPAELAVKVILDAMSASLSRGGRIEVRGFGSLRLNYRPPRQGHNPKTGDRVKVPAKYVPHFKASKELRERVSLPARTE